MDNFEIRHVNTGCLYEADGQKITIADDGAKTYFFDHSRMVDGVVGMSGLSIMGVIREYVKGNYSHYDMEPNLRLKFREFWHNADFKDVSSQYRTQVRIGW